MEVPRLRTRPPVEADGFFLRRNPSLGEPSNRNNTKSPGWDMNKEVHMGQLIVVGLVLVAVSVAAAALMSRRKPVYVVVRQGNVSSSQRVSHVWRGTCVAP